MKNWKHIVFVLVAGLVMLLLAIGACSSGEDTSSPQTSPLPSASPLPTIEPPPTKVLPLWTGDPQVETVFGEVKGFEDESNTWVWKAIPYARPPVGELRWKAPRDPQSWEGVLENEEFCEMCIQYDALEGKEVWGNEDCLYLNVWRPRTEETNLPVYVWIHGGGNAIGSANQTPTYMGASVAGKSDMVFVSMNYRLGPFGWFTHPALRTGDALDDSGNYGTLDIIKSLEWIQGNIEAFGGDPDRVIVTGESAGAVNIFSLLMSPVAEGLFHSALLQSGMQASESVEYGQASADIVLARLLVNDSTVSDLAEAEAYLRNMSDADIQAYLRSKTPDDIMGCYDQRGFGMVDSPFIFTDGSVIVSEGTGSFTNGTYPNKVPIMIGSTKEELKMFLFMNEEMVQDEALYQAVASYGSDLWKVNGVDDVCRKITSYDSQPDVYAYQFNWGAYQEDGSSPIPEPYDLTIGAAHSLDNPFFLGNPSFNVIMTNWVFTEENRAGREALTDAMMKYVARFARTGDPNGNSLPQWHPWTNGEGQPKCILFDADMDEAIIQMSDEELTVEKVIENMRAEVPEPLFSEAIEFISNEWTISHLLERVDIDDTTPGPTTQPSPSPEPTASPSPTLSPSPTEPATGDRASTAVYNVHYEAEGVTDDTVWTLSTVGEETIDGVDCHVMEVSFDKEPQRVMVIEVMNMSMNMSVTALKTWADKQTGQPVKAESSNKAMGFLVSTDTTFSYEGDYGFPLAEGKTWSYESVSTPSMGEPVTTSMDVVVTGMEEVTVPAGTYSCYRVVNSNESGETTTEWWSAEGDYPMLVKVVDEASWEGVETRELVSVSE